MMIVALATTCIVSVSAVNENKVRSEAFFLTDKMAYELSLNSRQIDDVFEINFDFVYSIQNIMPSVMRGEPWAVNRFYSLLDFRNEDLRWVLNARQYSAFMNDDYFFRPVYVSNSGWGFRIYNRYVNINLNFFSRPKYYSTYRFDHSRPRYGAVSRFSGRYNHNVFRGSSSIRAHKEFERKKEQDFGRVATRPGVHNTRPNTHTTRPNVNTTTRPSGNSSSQERHSSKNSSRSQKGSSATNNSSSRAVEKESNRTNSSSAQRSTTNSSREVKRTSEKTTNTSKSAVRQSTRTSTRN